MRFFRAGLANRGQELLEILLRHPQSVVAKDNAAGRRGQAGQNVDVTLIPFEGSVDRHAALNGVVGVLNQLADEDLLSE